MTKKEKELADWNIMRATEGLLANKPVKIGRLVLSPESILFPPKIRKRLCGVLLPRLGYFKWYRKWEQRKNMLSILREVARLTN